MRRKSKQDQTISGREWALIIVARAYCLARRRPMPASSPGIDRTIQGGKGRVTRDGEGEESTTEWYRYPSWRTRHISLGTGGQGCSVWQSR